MKGLDLSKFKKVNSDENKTVFKHEDGHFLHVSHKKLKPEHVKQLGKLGVQKFAQGGNVDEEESVLNAEAQDALSGNTPMQADEPKMEMPQAPDMASSFKAAALKGYNPEGMMEVTGQNEPQEEAAPQAQPGEIDLGAQQRQPAMQPDMQMGTPGLDQMKAGINNYAKAQGQLGEANANTIDEHERSMQQLQQQNAETDAKYDQEHAALVKDIQDTKIDANHYFHNLSTAGKISTAVGLLLGGLGGIASGGRNLALEAINKNIDQDLEAQKANQSGKLNLLSAMERHYGDKLVARNAAHAVQLESVKNELLKNANKAMTPMAKAQAQQALGQIQTQIDTLGMQNKQRLQALNAVQSGNPQAAAQAVPLLVPEKHQGEAFKELNEVHAIDDHVKQIENTMNKVASLQTLGHRFSSPLQSKSQIDALNLNIAAMAKSLFGRVNETELNQLLNKNTIKMTDNPESIRVKTQVLLDLAQEARNKNATLQAFGINLPQKPRTAPLR